MGRILVLVLNRINNFVRIIEPWGVFLGAFALLLALISFALELDDQRDERLFRAWEFLHEFDQTARALDNSEGEIHVSPAGAVYQALEFLNREVEGRFCASWLKSTFHFFTGSTIRECLLPSRARQSLANLYLQAIKLERINLSKADLVATDFSNADLSRANLEYAKLVGANLKYAKLVGANLKYAALSGAKLEHAFILGANLKNAHLNGAHLKGAFLCGANLKDAFLLGAEFNGAYLKHASFESADLSESKLIKACMKETDLTDANLNEANLGGGDLTNAELNGADLSVAIFENTNVTGAKFTHAKGLTAKQLSEACVSDRNKPPELPISLTTSNTYDWNNQICDEESSMSACELWEVEMLTLVDDCHLARLGTTFE